MLDSILFSLDVTLPIFMVMVLGFVLKRTGWIDETFVNTATRLVFNFGLPTLLFLNISAASPGLAFSWDLILVGVVVTLVGGALMVPLARFVPNMADRGVVIQAGYRSNLAIVGLAYCAAAYGEQGLVLSSMFIAVVTLLFNVMAVVVLNVYLSGNSHYWAQIKSMLTNPLIIGICAALPFSIWGIQVPSVVRQSGGYLAQLSLPIALICTGASLSLLSIKADSRATLAGVTGKLLLLPILAIIFGVWVGLGPMELGVLVMMMAAPTAAASYTMVRTMGGNSALAANLIGLTTVFSVVSVSSFLSILRFLDRI